MRKALLAALAILLLLVARHEVRDRLKPFIVTPPQPPYVSPVGTLVVQGTVERAEVVGSDLHLRVWSPKHGRVLLVVGPKANVVSVLPREEHTSLVAAADWVQKNPTPHVLAGVHGGVVTEVMMTARD